MSKSCALPKSVFPVKFKVKSPVHALELARQLIRPFKRWTVNVLATDFTQNELGEDQELDVKSPKAEAFCALGALLRVNTKHAKKAEQFLAQAAWLINGGDPDLKSADRNEIFSVNDDEGYGKEQHRTVLKMFTKAIALAKKAAKVKK